MSEALVRLILVLAVVAGLYFAERALWGARNPGEDNTFRARLDDEFNTSDRKLKAMQFGLRLAALGAALLIARG